MGIFEQVVAAIFTAAITALVSWSYRISGRVTALEAQKQQLENLEKLMGTKYDALKELIEVKFDNIHNLLLLQSRWPSMPADEPKRRD